jgi:hypothetical protein
LVLSQPLTKLNHRSVPLLIELSIPRKSGQLAMVLEPTSCGCILLFQLEACYFCEKPFVSHAPFTCLFLKCLSHPKWSHLCHCSPYSSPDDKDPWLPAQVSLYLFSSPQRPFVPLNPQRRVLC